MHAMWRVVLLLIVSGALMLATGVSSASATTTPTVTVQSGTFDPHSGTVTITGTATCPTGYFGYLYGSVSQSVGRVATIQGYFDTGLVCDGSSHTWSATVYLYAGGQFRGGKAIVSYSYYMYPADYTGEFFDGYGDSTIILRGR